MTKNDQRIFFDLLRAENSKILYITLAFLISFILTAIFKTQLLEITTFALLAVIAIWAMSQEHKDKKTYTTHYGHIVIQYPVQERINPFTKKPETPSVHFEMFIREPLFTTLNSPIFPRKGHYDDVLKDFEKFQTMIKLIIL